MNVYKSEEGRLALEGFYRRVLGRYEGPPFEELTIPTRQAATRVFAFGPAGAPPLVAIHGSVSNSSAWLGMAPLLARGFRLYCVDIPGEPGLSEPNRPRMAGNEPSAWLSDVMDGLKLRSAGFLGMSLGGWYSLDFTLRYPERVSALCLITSGGLVRPRASFLPRVIGLSLLGKRGQAALDRLIYRDAPITGEAREFQRLAARHFVPLLEPLPVFDSQALAGIKVPLLFFGGKKDALIDSDASGRRLARLVTGADIRILENAGHVILGIDAEVYEYFNRHLSA